MHHITASNSFITSKHTLLLAAELAGLMLPVLVGLRGKVGTKNPHKLELTDTAAVLHEASCTWI